MSAAYPEPLQQIDRTCVLWRGRKLSYFAGCDYLRLSSHPAVLAAVHSSLDEFGLNVAASRKTTGNHQIYHHLETAVRKFFASEAAVTTSTGYFTNIIAAQGLRGSIDHVLIDERAHASLRDAAQFLSCPITEFKHRDARDLKKKCTPLRAKRLALLTDGMFAHDGSIAPLAEYREAIGNSTLFWVDDAHAGGILGRNGRGTIELARLSRQNLLQTVTFSKAFGSYGGAILCSRSLANKIQNKSCAVAGNTPLPLPLACATMTALQLCDAVLRQKLFKNIAQFWNVLGKLPDAPLTPIIPLSVKNSAALSRKLLAAEIFPPWIKYAGGPSSGYFRFALSSEHSSEQIERLALLVRESCLTPKR